MLIPQCHLGFALLALILFPTLRFAADDAAKPTPENVAKWINDLSSEKFRTREQATRHLLAAKARAIDALEKVLQRKTDLETHLRAQRLLEKLEIYRPGGEIINGLKIRVSCLKPTLKRGQAAILSVSFCNMTDKPMKLCFGDTLNGHNLTRGALIQRCDEKFHLPRSLVPIACGESKSIIDTLPPKSAQTWRVALQLIGEEKSPRCLLGTGEFYHPLGNAKQLRLCIPYEMSPAAYHHYVRCGDKVVIQRSDGWAGKVVSNEVVIRVD